MEEIIEGIADSIGTSMGLGKDNPKVKYKGKKIPLTGPIIFIIILTIIWYLTKGT